MQKLTFLTLLFFSLQGMAQKIQYVVFEEHSIQDTINVAPFNLVYNHVKLADSLKRTSGLDILNLYFSKYNFKAYGLDRKAFVQGATDFKKFENDVLITFTPLTDSLKYKMVKLSNDEVKNLTIVKPEELLQIAIKNLYRCFTTNDIAGDEIPGVIKSTKYKLLIKKGNTFYRVNTQVLTEYYLINRASYLFPSQYHYGEINVGNKDQTRYFSGQDIREILRQVPSGTMNDYYPSITIARGIYLSSVELIDNCNVYTYWSYPTYFEGIPGIGRFQFIEGVGIVNGIYGAYLVKNFLTNLH
jgi:hypothetical protein